MSNIVQKQIEDIQTQGTKRLQELSIIVLFLLIPMFLEIWFASLVVQDASSWLLSFNVIMMIVAIIFFIGIVWYSWKLRNAPQFHVLFIESKEEREHIDRESFLSSFLEHIDKENFLRSFLVPVGVSIGLAFTILSYGLSPHYWWSSEHPIVWSLEYTPQLSFYPLIIVACSSIILYYTYRIKPKSVQGIAPSVLFIPLILPIFTELLLISTLARSIWEFFGKSVHHITDIDQLIPLFSFRALFITSLLVLLYLTYRVSVDQRDVSPPAKEKHLQGYIDKGVGILPKRVRVGDSYNISLDLILNNKFREACGTGGHKFKDYLEAELQAVGLEVNREKRLKICEDSSLPIIGWNCIFLRPGTHTINLVFNLVKCSDSRDLIFMHKHTVKVDSFLGGSWMSMLALITPIFLGLLQWLHH